MPLILRLTTLWCFNRTFIVWREFKCLWFCAWLHYISIERSLCEGNSNASVSVPDYTRRFNRTFIVWREYKCLWFCTWLHYDISIERSLCEWSTNASGSVPECSVTFSSLHPIVIVTTTLYPFPWTRCSSLFVTSPSTISANYSDEVSHRTFLIKV